MCGRYVLEDAAHVFTSLLCDTEPPTQLPLGLMLPRYNIAPTQRVPVVRPVLDLGCPEVVGMRWGLVPGWIRDIEDSTLLINAPAETVATKPTFRWAYRSRRCLIPASGFYEWRKRGKAKEPYYFRRIDGQPFCFAGLWERWEKGGVVVESCTLLTTEANAVVAPIHDRMPVMLHQADWDRWMMAPTANGLEGLLVPFPAEEMAAHPVSPQVNNVWADKPGLIAPVANVVEDRIEDLR